MIEITKILPIVLIETLNNFNEELSDFRRDIKFETTTTPIKLNSVNYDNIRIRYDLKNSSFFFEISYVVKGDYISWNYYPFTDNSTKPRSKSRVQTSNSVYNELRSHFKSWKGIISKITELKNPLEYFDIDNFVEFYSAEVYNEIPTTDFEEKYPLHTDKQDLARKLIEKQTKFLEKEISKTEDKESDKYFDLLLAKNNLSDLNKQLPRMTVADVKRKWSISLGIIMKWCLEQFLKYFKADKASGFEISRSLGSFVGGVFGIPKVDQ